MYTLDSLQHINCSLAHGPGERSPNCEICLEPKAIFTSTIVHSVCLNSFHRSCFDELSQSCRDRNRDVTCPCCRVVLVHSGKHDEESGSDGHDEPAATPDTNLDVVYWRRYLARRNLMLQNAGLHVQQNVGPVYLFVSDESALQIHMHYEQVHSHSLLDALCFRYCTSRRYRERLWSVAATYGVDTFRCYRAVQGMTSDYILTADYLDEHTQGVRSARAYGPIPANVMEMQKQILLLERRE